MAIKYFCGRKQVDVIADYVNGDAMIWNSVVREHQINDQSKKGPFNIWKRDGRLSNLRQQKRLNASVALKESAMSNTKLSRTTFV